MVYGEASRRVTFGQSTTTSNWSALTSDQNPVVSPPQKFVNTPYAKLLVTAISYLDMLWSMVRPLDD